MKAEKSSELIPKKFQKFPVGETTKALIRVTPFDYRDVWFKHAFEMYQVLTPGMYSLLTTLIFLKMSYHALRFDPPGKLGELFRNGLTSLLFLRFFPHFFKQISLIIQGLQEHILDFKMTAGALQQATFHSTDSFLKVILMLTLSFYTGPIGWCFTALVALCTLLPPLIFTIYSYAFKLGIVVLIFSAPFVFVLGPIFNLGIAVSAFFWMLISSMIWPLYWVAIGRVAFQALGEMNVLEAFGFTLIVSVCQVWVPIQIMKTMRGINPGESTLSMFGKVAQGVASLATSLPLGSVAAPLLGMASGAHAFLGGARLSSGGAQAAGGGMSSAGRMMAGFRAYQGASRSQKERGSFSGEGNGSFLDQSTYSLGRVGAHFNRAKKSLRGAEGKNNLAAVSSRGAFGNSISENPPSVYENPSIYSLNFKDLARYGMLRHAEKQAQKWHYGTLGFLSASRSSGVRSSSTPSPVQRLEKSSATPRLLENSKGNSRLLEIGGKSLSSSGESMIHLGGTMHAQRASPRIIPMDPSRKRNAEWLQKNSKHFHFKEVTFPKSTSQGMESVRGYAAYSKKTGNPKAYFVPRSRAQEEEILRKPLET